MTESIFVDTSALYAVLDADDDHSPQASALWEHLLNGIGAREFEGITHYSIVVETSALVQRRLGMVAVRDLHDALLPALEICWIDRELHERAVAAMLGARKRDVSLVDWTSFELMRIKGIDRALAFDDDFTKQGFGEFD